MMIFSEEIKKTTALLNLDSKFIGSGVIFLNKDKLYFITAGHNVYGKEFDKTWKKEQFSIVINGSIPIPIKEICGDVEFAKKNDIVILELKKTPSHDLKQFISIKFATIPKNPVHNLILRGKYSNVKDIVNKSKIYYDQLNDQNNNQFLVNIPKDQLINSSFSSGSEWLGGMSGSGLFYDNYSKIICAGILIEIKDKGDNGKLLIAGISCLKELVDDIDIIDSHDLDLDTKFSSRMLLKIIEDVDVEVIREWEEKVENNPQLYFINKKLEQIYPPSELLKNKIRVIKTLISGINFLELELKNNEQLYNNYYSAYSVYDVSEDKTSYVNSKKEAKEFLDKMTDKYEKYLEVQLSDKIDVSIIKLLTSYGISNWISNCSLDFLKDE
ncbi:hypothetical protein FNW52_11780 [Flavobacterium sp. ZT3R18]|uniref:hypothetical protein n=1 Tax=Flavobacterium sp. ZT3R18 TaxID=2594429 RepID=UPI00117B222E|nr:hypothetical protein [Flavobacterium sp. ZT3R18]TRX35106.1 hypothetical protein FNW52_11780 [Flavobacterium sp. ZT3R18]